MKISLNHIDSITLHIFILMNTKIVRTRAPPEPLHTRMHEECRRYTFTYGSAWYYCNVRYGVARMHIKEKTERDTERKRKLSNIHTYCIFTHKLPIVIFAMRQTEVFPSSSGGYANVIAPACANLGENINLRTHFAHNCLPACRLVSVPVCRHCAYNSLPLFRLNTHNMPGELTNASVRNTARRIIAGGENYYILRLMCAILRCAIACRNNRTQLTAGKANTNTHTRSSHLRSRSIFHRMLARHNTAKAHDDRNEMTQICGKHMRI